MLQPPASVNSTAQMMQSITVGNNIFVFGTTPGYVSSMKYSITGDVEKYPDGSLVVECGTTGNKAEILSAETDSVTINVKNVYYSNGATLSPVTGYVRVSGEQWQQIQ